MTWMTPAMEYYLGNPAFVAESIVSTFYPAMHWRGHNSFPWDLI